MSKVTIQPIKGMDLSVMEKGDIIEFQKTPSPVSEVQIKAYYKGKEIGIIAEAKTNLLPDTVSSSKVFNDVPDRFSGVVEESILKATATKKYFLIVSLNGVGGSANANTSTSEEQLFSFKIAGSTTVNVAKSDVIADSSKGKTFVTFELKNDKIIAMYNGKQAGVVSAKNESGNATQEERETFMQILSEKDDKTVIEGKVVSVTTSSYIAQVSMSISSIEKAKTSVTKKAMGGIKEPLIEAGFDETVLNSIENYLLDNKFTVKDISDIFATYKTYPTKYQHLIPTQPKRLYDDKKSQVLYDTYASLAEGFNVICSGEKGTGKNVFIETWAWILQRPLFAISINRETDKTDLLGSKTIEPVKVKDEVTGEETYVSKIVFQKEVLLEAMEVGGLLNIDEINFADPGVTGLLHSVGDDRKCIFVPGYGLVQGDENFIMMATMNLGYQGTLDLNEALADRFVDIVFKNNDSILEILESNCPDVPKSSITACDKIYSKIVGALRDADSSLDDSCVTVRGFIQALKMSKRIPLKRALIRGVADKIKDTDYRQNVVDIIEMIVH